MRKKMLGIIGLSAVLIVLISACNLVNISGSGTLITETRNVSSFDRVSLNGSGNVIITQGEQESLVVETDDNIMEYVTTEVRGGTLELGLSSVRGEISPTRLTFTLVVDNLEGLEIAGSGNIQGERIDTDTLEVTVNGSGDIRIDSLTADLIEAEINGSGEIELAGEAAEQDIQINGSGDYRAEDLLSETVTVDIGGSGDTTVWATNSLDVAIGGSGTVNYYGAPSVNSTSSGSGSINNLGQKG